MLRFVPEGCVGPLLGLLVGDGLALPVGRGVLAVGVGAEQLPLETSRPLLAPAVWLTIVGTQLAGSRLYPYGMLMLVLAWTLGPAGWFSVPGLVQVTLSKMLPATCQLPIRSV